MNGSVIVIGPEEDIIEKVYTLLLPDYPSNIVVFPGKRPGHYLRRLIGERTGRAYVPPAIVSIDEFIALLFKRALDYKPAEVIDAVAILYELLKDSPAIHEEFRKLDNFYSFGIRLFRSLEELYIEYISPERLREVETLMEIPEKSGRDIRFLADLYARFYEELKNRRLSTRSFRYRTVAESEPFALLDKNIKRLIFAGFFVFTEAEKRFIKKLFGIDSEIERLMVFQYGDGIRDTIRDLGFDAEVPEFYKGRDSVAILNKKIFLYSAPDIHGEVKAVGTKLKGLDTIDEKTVIVLPQADTLFPLIRQGIPYLENQSYNISMGYPLTKTPIYGFFISLFEVISAFENGLVYVPYYLKFILHPYVKNITFHGSAELNRLIIHTMEELFRNEQTQPFITLEEIESIMPDRMFHSLNDAEHQITPDEIRRQLSFIHDNTIRRFIQIQNIGDFAKNCVELLLFIHAHSTAKYHPLFFPYVEGFIKELDKLSFSAIKELSFERRESYFNFFKKLLAHATIPFEGTPLRGLQILGFLETRNIKFKKVFFLDLIEGVFPEPFEDYILPYNLRKTLGLPTHRERERLLHYYFDTLIKGAEEVHLFYVKNENTERSRFIEKLLWEIESRTVISATDLPEITVNYQVRLQPPTPKEIVKSDEIISILNNFIWSSSSLDMYLSCGIKFYYFHILNLKKRESISDEPTGKEIGILIHESLKKYFQRRLNTDFTEENSGAEISEIVDRIFRERYGVASGRLYLLRHQIIKRLKEFLMEFPFRNAMVTGVEQVIASTLFSHTFKGIADLILRDENGRTVIIDFKTSSTKSRVEINFKKLEPARRETWPEAIKSIQIPLYMMLYSKDRATELEAIDGYYVLLGRNSITNGDFLYSPINHMDRGSTFNRLSEILRGLIDEIKSPDIPFAPPIDLKDVCPDCDFRALCGTEWVERPWRR